MTDTKTLAYYADRCKEGIEQMLKAKSEKELIDGFFLADGYLKTILKDRINELRSGNQNA